MSESINMKNKLLKESTDEKNIIEESILQFFKYSHLSPPLSNISADFSHMAHNLVKTLPKNPERTVALRKLLEAKDCAVRAAIYKQ